MGRQAIAKNIILSLALCCPAGCDAVFGELSRQNPNDCVANPGLCVSPEQCDPVSHLCFLPDAAPAGDAATPVYSFKPVSGMTTKNLYGVWGTDANNIWMVGQSGTIRSSKTLSPSATLL